MNGDSAPIEHSRRERLARVRAQSAHTEADSQEEKPDIFIYALAFAFALFSDGIDLVVGWIPIVGDILDVVTALLLIGLFLINWLMRPSIHRLIPIGLVVVALIIEFIPFVITDLFPSWFGSIALAWRIERYYGKIKKVVRKITHQNSPLRA